MSPYLTPASILHTDLSPTLLGSEHDEQSSSSSDDFANRPTASCTSSEPFTDKPQLPSPFSPSSLSFGNPKPLPASYLVPKVPHEAAFRSIDHQDIGTPDSWIPRDPRLIRLTGKHPFNCEAPLKDLFAEGFLTPTNLFYVRNHGAVPHVDMKSARDWKLEVNGLCANPTTFLLGDLCLKFEVVTVPITLVCAGNRRKEQNVVQKSLGFSWGAAGLSTALFTGVYLSDVLDYVCPSKVVKHVVFEGCDDLPNGPYGTSQRYSWARDKGKGMMLCWAMNGLPLEPDHGFPLRLVVPGQIGGRSVKWLTKIELSLTESQHHLHFHDNKVLPTTLGPDQARKEARWWYDPRYIINDLNVNSAITVPDHNDIIDIPLSAADQYTVKGYAYAGGGRRVTRVEISLDDGSTWDLAEVTYPEDLFRAVVHSDPVYGRLDIRESDDCFCWCFWSFQVDVMSLATKNSISVRCMDESLALQPRDMYWNATGMMNNWWFRVAIHRLDGDRLQFEHPTLAGTQPGGWMQRLKDAGFPPGKPRFASVHASIAPPLAATVDEKMTAFNVTRNITAKEFLEAKDLGKPWFVVRGEVYDGTDFLDKHPGGSHSITLVAGQDATEDFLAIHSSDARKQMADFHIGTLDGTLHQPPSLDHSAPSTIFLNAKAWKRVVLTGIKDVSKDSKVFRFAMDHGGQELGLPTGQHVYVRLRRKASDVPLRKGALVQRAYTPLSRCSDRGTFELLIKIYYPTSANPEGGRMTVGFSELSVGDAVELKGPVGHFVWKGRNKALVGGKECIFREIGMVCGGSGITPILQVLRGILADSMESEDNEPQVKVWVLDANRDSDDILCRDELDELAGTHSTRFLLHYTLTGKVVPSDWPFSTGRINEVMLRDHLPLPSDGGIICLCGPPSMENNVKDLLENLGWNVKSQVVTF